MMWSIASLGCAAVPPPPPVDAAALAARLPAVVAGFERRGTLPLPQGGFEIAYATEGRVAAGATIEIDEPAGFSGDAGSAALDALLQAATQAPAHRRLTVRGRLRLPSPDPLLDCAMLEGRLGRERVSQLLCAGIIAGAAVRLRAAMPWRDPAVADAESFAGQLATALAGRR